MCTVLSQQIKVFSGRLCPTQRICCSCFNQNPSQLWTQTMKEMQTFLKNDAIRLWNTYMKRLVHSGKLQVSIRTLLMILIVVIPKAEVVSDMQYMIHTQSVTFWSPGICAIEVAPRTELSRKYTSINVLIFLKLQNCSFQGFSRKWKNPCNLNPNHVCGCCHGEAFQRS